MKKATLIGFGVMLALLATGSSANAQYCYRPVPTAPDMIGTGFYSQNCCGAWCGPNYYVYPPFPPFNGMILGPKGGPGLTAMPGIPWYAGMPSMPSVASYPAAQYYGLQGQVGFPNHPFARSPRDFFMYEEKR